MSTEAREPMWICDLFQHEGIGRSVELLTCLFENQAKREIAQAIPILKG